MGDGLIEDLAEDEGGAEAAEGAPGTLSQIDFDVAESQTHFSGVRLVKGVAVGLFLVVPLLAFLTFLLSQVSLVFRIVGFSVAGGLLIWLLMWLTRRAKRRVREFVAAQKRGDPGTWVTAALGVKKPAAADVMIAECFGQIVAAGLVGATIRVCKSKLAIGIDPIVHRFEPVVLDEAEDAFVELMEASEDGAATAGEGPAQTAGERRSIRRLKSRLRQFGGWGPLVMAAVFSARYFVELARFGRISVGLFVWTAVIAMWVMRLSGSGFRSNQWFAVPGGVAVRRARRGTHDWDVTVYSRRESVLCAYTLPRKLWMVMVSGAGLRAARAFTRAETEMLLRAWLSPLEPPEAGMLSDLT